MRLPNLRNESVQLAFNTLIQPYFFSNADPSEKFQFSNHYNFGPDELFRLKSSQLSILSGVFHC
jgi:hypothetical protein